MGTVRSKSSATIAYDRSGFGPPLVLVHGSLSDNTTWRLVRPAWEQSYTVYAVNRRGREGSGPVARHKIEEEFEDVAAVVDRIQEPVHLLGHSMGALCALGATLYTDNVRSLLLYEPPPPGLVVSNGMETEIRAQLEAGDADEAVATFLTKGPEVPYQAVSVMRRDPSWPERVRFASSLVEEIEAIAHYEFDPAQFAGLSMPILLLLGDQSAPKLRATSDALRRVRRDARIVMLPGQGHVAHLMAPDLFANEVKRFLATV